MILSVGSYLHQNKFSGLPAVKQKLFPSHIAFFASQDSLQSSSRVTIISTVFVSAVELIRVKNSCKILVTISATTCSCIHTQTPKDLTSPVCGPADRPLVAANNANAYSMWVFALKLQADFSFWAKNLVSAVEHVALPRLAAWVRSYRGLWSLKLYLWILQGRHQAVSVKLT